MRNNGDRPRFNLESRKEDEGKETLCSVPNAAPKMSMGPSSAPGAETRSPRRLLKIPPPSSESAKPTVAQGAVPQPAKKSGAKKKVPIIVGAVAAVIVVALVAVFVVIPGMDKSPFKGAQVGDKVEFGSYEQDGDTSNGKEPIEWRVLAVKDGRALVVSEEGLDSQAFNSASGKGNKWDSSDLKNWLENDFASQAFSSDEMKDIDGAPTLLSVNEANKYFKSAKDRICYSTKQAAKNGAWKSDANGACRWWLRSPGVYSGLAAGVASDGLVEEGGIEVDNESNVVRPAMWVNL